MKVTEEVDEVYSEEPKDNAKSAKEEIVDGKEYISFGMIKKIDEEQSSSSIFLIIQMEYTYIDHWIEIPRTEEKQASVEDQEPSPVVEIDETEYMVSTEESELENVQRKEEVNQQAEEPKEEKANELDPQKGSVDQHDEEAPSFNVMEVEEPQEEDYMLSTEDSEKEQQKPEKLIIEEHTKEDEEDETEDKLGRDQQLMPQEEDYKNEKLSTEESEKEQQKPEQPKVEEHPKVDEEEEDKQDREDDDENKEEDEKEEEENYDESTADDEHVQKDAESSDEERKEDSEEEQEKGKVFSLVLMISLEISDAEESDVEDYEQNLILSQLEQLTLTKEKPPTESKVEQPAIAESKKEEVPEEPSPVIVAPRRRRLRKVVISSDDDKAEEPESTHLKLKIITLFSTVRNTLYK